ncbi:PqiC family protein [Methylomonas sp. HW2-6]|uniref:PqiC family protein n=1 Tax=Methylomonas sp. HW2-6 TaxID=3376687 RepID=UPI00404103AA
MIGRRWIYSALAAAAIAGLAACGSAPLQFYMLTADSGASNESGPALAPGTVIGLGPIRLPAYLDRPQLVTALSDHQYRLDEHNRWAERLDENIARTLSQTLAIRLGVEQVVRYSWPARQRLDYQLGFDILELHQTAAGRSVLSAQWQLKQGERNLAGKRFECSEAAADNAEAIVAAQSACLSRFAAELAGAVRAAAAAH